MNRYCNLKYAIWNIDLQYLKDNCSIVQDIEQAFLESPEMVAPEKVGEGKSLSPAVLPTLPCYSFLYDFISQQIQGKFGELDIPNYYKRQKLKLRRCWANQTFQNTQGTIHNHPNSMVFLLYYKAPINSSKLVFIDNKHHDKFGQTEDKVPIENKQYINVTEGMCLLHDGGILHAVSPHNNKLPREVLVFEFNSVFN